jgi:hypothetical protein
LLADAEASFLAAGVDSEATGVATVKSRVPNFFVERIGAIRRAKEQEGYTRLDATYYSPRVGALRKQVSEAGGRTLVKRVPGVVLIGKTFVEGVHKVDQEYGVPYFTGKELFKTRPIPETFITSRRRASIEKLIVQRGTTLVTCAGTVGKVMYVRGALEHCAVTHDAIRVLPGRDVHPGYVYAYLASPNGQAELQRCSYGSVIPRLYRTHVENVVIPKTKDGGEKVGQLVDRAFDLRQEALEVENGGIDSFLQCLSKGRIASERKWGREY